MKGQKFLKVTSVLMIVSGIIAIIFGIIALLGMSAISLLSEGEANMGMLYASMILVLFASVIELIAGVKGNTACKAPETAKKCIPWGIAVAALSIISMILGVAGGGSFSVTTFVLNLLIPGLYVYGAKQIHDGMSFIPDSVDVPNVNDMKDAE